MSIYLYCFIMIIFFSVLWGSGCDGTARTLRREKMAPISITTAPLLIDCLYRSVCEKSVGRFHVRVAIPPITFGR